MEWHSTCRSKEHMQNGLHVYPYLCSELVTVTSHDSSGEAKVMSGNLEEIGEWSARVLLDSPLHRGSQVTVNAGDNCLNGRVKSWSFEPDLGYFVDVRLNSESRWTKAWFTPEHMLGPWNEATETSSERPHRDVAA